MEIVYEKTRWLHRLRKCCLLWKHKPAVESNGTTNAEQKAESLLSHPSWTWSLISSSFAVLLVPIPV